MSTALALDHLGLCARDPAPLWAVWEGLGFALSPVAQQSGRRTPDGPVEPFGSANRCAFLRHGYVELLGILDPAPVFVFGGDAQRHACASEDPVDAVGEAGATAGVALIALEADETGKRQVGDHAHIRIARDGRGRGAGGSGGGWRCRAGRGEGGGRFGRRGDGGGLHQPRGAGHRTRDFLRGGHACPSDHCANNRACQRHPCQNHHYRPPVPWPHAGVPVATALLLPVWPASLRGPCPSGACACPRFPPL
jgi:hypothetical protein